MADVVAECVFLDLEAVRPEQRLMGNGPQRHDDLQLGHGLNLFPQEAIALANLGGCRFVGGRQAADRIGDPAVAQAHRRIGPAIGPERRRAAGEPETMQGRIEQFAGDIPGKRTACAIGPFFPGAQANDQQLRIQ